MWGQTGPLNQKEPAMREIIDYAECAGAGHKTPARDYWGNFVDDYCPGCGTCLSDLDAEAEAHWAAIIKAGEQ
jgi:Pyruvate/2-oxoacid:ferredoxin oxidoreductase delta subunit